MQNNHVSHFEPIEVYFVTTSGEQVKTSQSWSLERRWSKVTGTVKTEEIGLCLYEIQQYACQTKNEDSQ